jgi:hypothetical protein
MFQKKIVEKIEIHFMFINVSVKYCVCEIMWKNRVETRQVIDDNVIGAERNRLHAGGPGKEYRHSLIIFKNYCIIEVLFHPIS